MAKIKLTNQQMFTENPFVEKAIEQINENTKKTYRWLKGNKLVQQYAENEEGKIIAHAAFVQQVEVDETQFAKLYLSQLGVFFDLPKTALRVFTYILNSLQPKSDRVFINLREALKYTGYKDENSIISGLAILCDKGFIARSEVHYMYFINPMVFFNGNRITFAKTYIRKREKALKNDPNQLSFNFVDVKSEDLNQLQSDYNNA